MLSGALKSLYNLCLAQDSRGESAQCVRSWLFLMPHSWRPCRQNVHSAVAAGVSGVSLLFGRDADSISTCLREALTFARGMAHLLSSVSEFVVPFSSCPFVLIGQTRGASAVVDRTDQNPQPPDTPQQHTQECIDVLQTLLDSIQALVPPESGNSSVYEELEWKEGGC